jgi:hypothetical protein
MPLLVSVIIVIATPPESALNCTTLTIPFRDWVPGLIAPRTNISPQETVVRRQAINKPSERVERRRFIRHLQSREAVTDSVGAKVYTRWPSQVVNRFTSEITGDFVPSTVIQSLCASVSLW